LTGITNEELSRADDVGVILPKFLNFIGREGIFVAHNALFDWSFINEELKRVSMQPLTCNRIDTIRVAKDVVPGLKSYSLKSLIEYFEFDHIKNHRALDDARITAQLFLHLLNPLNAATSKAK